MIEGKIGFAPNCSGPVLRKAGGYSKLVAMIVTNTIILIIFQNVKDYPCDRCVTWSDNGKPMAYINTEVYRFIEALLTASKSAACLTRSDETGNRRCDQVLPIATSVLRSMLRGLEIEEMFADVNAISCATHYSDA